MSALSVFEVFYKNLLENAGLLCYNISKIF